MQSTVEGGTLTSGTLRAEDGRGYGGWEPGSLTLSILAQEAHLSFSLKKQKCG